jgi:hypothetical protein
MESTNRHPDMLRRFVATPYIFNLFSGEDSVSIQSNDLEVALKVRHLCLTGGRQWRIAVKAWKLIREAATPAEQADLLVFENRPLKTLHRGINTMLVYDRARGELLGFVASDVNTNELITSLIPALIQA